MPQDYYPSGPFLSLLPDAGDFDVLREDYLLGFAERTARAYKADLEDFREWCAKRGVDPINASAIQLEGYVGSLSERGYAASSIARRVAGLRGFFAHLVSRGVHQSSSAQGLRSPRPRVGRR